jgi:hypothetical protein
MTNPPPKPPAPRAAGALIAFGLIAGPIIGLLLGQTSLGLLIGFGLGVIIATLFWLADRKRK